ncbi:MAG: glycosyltransferase family 9 protein [Acidobacteriota bacterium]
MFQYLQISNPVERTLVGLVDLALWIVTAPLRALGSPGAAPPRRVLAFRLERVGDLLMTRPALRALRHAFGSTSIDLVVGSWNAPLARLLPEVDRVFELDVGWLARGAPSSRVMDTVGRIREWRRGGYDIAINFEPDVRSNLLLWTTGAPRRFGFRSSGGGQALTVGLDYDPSVHSAFNSLRLVASLTGETPVEADLATAPLVLPEVAVRAAASRLSAAGRFPPDHPFIAVHPSGGRLVKQWDLGRLAEASVSVARSVGASLVVTGSTSDRQVVDGFLGHLPPGMSVLDLTGRLDLVELAAVLRRCRLFLGSDSGPMHLAAAVGTPVVAVFGPSSPVRWGPLGGAVAVARADLPCSPCNRIRNPPQRCRGGVPDCLRGVDAPDVVGPALELLRRSPLAERIDASR